MSNALTPTERQNLLRSFETAVRQMIQPPLDFTGPTRTTGEAMDLLERTRRDLIAQGREIARRLTANGGTATSCDVKRVMVAEGLYRDDVPGYWLGAVFRGREWLWTGRWEVPDEPSGAAHAWRPMKVWTREVPNASAR